MILLICFRNRIAGHRLVHPTRSYSVGNHGRTSLDARWAQGGPPSASTLHHQGAAKRASNQRLPSSATIHTHFSLSHPRAPFQHPLSSPLSREPLFGTRFFTSTSDSNINIQSEGSLAFVTI